MDIFFSPSHAFASYDAFSEETNHLFLGNFFSQLDASGREEGALFPETRYVGKICAFAPLDLILCRLLLARSSTAELRGGFFSGGSMGHGDLYVCVPLLYHVVGPFPRHCATPVEKSGWEDVACIIDFTVVCTTLSVLFNFLSFYHLNHLPTFFFFFFLFTLVCTEPTYRSPSTIVSKDTNARITTNPFDFFSSGFSPSSLSLSLTFFATGPVQRGRR